MKLTFSFTDTPDIQALRRDDIYNTHFEIPDGARHFIDCEERIRAVPQLVGKLTLASLHITCKELSLKNHFIKAVSSNPQSGRTVNIDAAVLMLRFERFIYRRRRRDLKILSPIPPPPPLEYLRKGTHFPLNSSWCKTDEDLEYANTVKSLAEQIMILLNAETNDSGSSNVWRCDGFYPRLRDNSLVDLLNRRIRKRIVEEEKRKAREAKLALNPQSEHDAVPQTGAGRRVGAVPGIYKGIQFRSQLEIRFATELDARQIRWVYEGERLGDGNYLVDFYLPDYRAWVEVKGKFEPRDDYLLKDVASFLKRERGEKLFVFGSKCFLVNPGGFRPLAIHEFFAKLLTTPSNHHRTDDMLIMNDQQPTTNDEE